MTMPAGAKYDDSSFFLLVWAGLDGPVAGTTVPTC